jgi:hypothetical protein
MAGTDGGRLHGLVDEQTVYAALDAIDEALEQALVAHTEREQRWQLNQLRGLLLTCRSGELGLEDCLRRLIVVLPPRWLIGNRTALGPDHGRGVRMFPPTTDRVDRSTTRAGHRPWDRAAPPSGPGHNLGGDGERLRVVARSDRDAVSGHAGQGGGPVVGHVPPLCPVRDAYRGGAGQRVGAGGVGL